MQKKRQHPCGSGNLDFIPSSVVDKLYNLMHVSSTGVHFPICEMGGVEKMISKIHSLQVLTWCGSEVFLCEQFLSLEGNGN